MTKSMMKAFKSHCGAMAKTCEAKAASCKELSDCQKAAVAAGLAKAASRDHYMDLHDCYKAEGESWSKMHDACGKGSDVEDLEKVVSAVSESVMTRVNERIGKMIVPDGVRKTFETSDPSGGRLIPRTGQPSPPTPAESIDPQFRNLFVE